MRRSMLFLPGNTPNMLINGDVLGADSVILDLEDAISPDEKDSARILVRNILEKMQYKNSEVIVRINSLDTGYWQDDLDAVIPKKPDIIMPTKVNDAETIRVISAYIGQLEIANNIAFGSIKMIPLLETTLGIENAFPIAVSDERIAALYLGAEDLTADLRCKRTKKGDEIFYSRSRLVCAARAAKIEAYDTPFTDIGDEEGLLADTQLAKSLGYSGKAAISPRQVSCINTAFTPSQAEIAHAQDVFHAIEEAHRFGKGAVSLHGKMIDAPIVERARQVLEAAAMLQGGTHHE